jgi:hypothetical protein
LIEQKLTEAAPQQIIGLSQRLEPKIQLYKPELILRLTPSQARGIIWLFHLPNRRVRYFMGADPAYGIPGWHPGLKTEKDLKSDNSALTVWGLYKDKIVQVAEYAGPVQPPEFAKIINALGRYYAGSDPQRMARLILESIVGPGPECERALLGKYHYYNFWTDKSVDNFELTNIGKLGWRPSLQSNKDISLNARKVLEASMPVVRSPWLAEELNDAELDPEKWKIHVPEGGDQHDDRLRSAMLAWWMIWGMEINSPAVVVQPEVMPGTSQNWQAMDVSAKKVGSLWAQRWFEIVNSK